ncbi:ABC transporter permease [Nocardia camponoti]|uniref:Uncharacterized protein n=1 Tax=Nocardia camponoti TaxID=1616106 RepID=A0A917V7B4_9NOCA|nr:ABC transporter permease [Nocardia camponoti]GGK47019.1 hypothetical protein GCM10011591_17900 [Nocardia camponoti]
MITVLPADVVAVIDTEARKVVSVRPNRLLLVAPTAIAVVGTLITALLAGPYDPKGQPHTGAATVGLYLAIAASCVVAAIIGLSSTGGEYRRETFALSVLFAPDRDRLVIGKYAAAAGIALGVAFTAELASALVLVIAARGKANFGWGFFEALGGGLIAAMCWAVIGAGLGLLARSFSTVLWLLLAWVVVFEPLMWLVAKSMSLGWVAAALPVASTVAGVTAGTFEESDFLAPAPAALVLIVLWACVVGAAGWWNLRDRDL